MENEKYKISTYTGETKALKNNVCLQYNIENHISKLLICKNVFPKFV